MLGINTPEKRIPEPSRNYAAVVPGDPEFVGMERAGLVLCFRAAGDGTEYDYYACTDKGRAVALLSFWNIQYSKPRRRYLRYLSIRESFPDLTFHEFLTDPQFSQTRGEA